MTPKTSKGKARCFVAKAGNEFVPQGTVVEVIADSVDKSTTYYDEDRVAVDKANTKEELEVICKAKYGDAKAKEIIDRLTGSAKAAVVAVLLSACGSVFQPVYEESRACEDGSIGQPCPVQDAGE